MGVGIDVGSSNKKREHETDNKNIIMKQQPQLYNEKRVVG
jgi:hypothetical protein